MNIQWVDLLRVFVLLQIIFVAVITAIIVILYSLHWKQRDPTRIMPYHIVAIGLSYLLAIVYIGANTWSRIGLNLSWHLPLSFAIVITGNLGLCLMVWHLIVQRRLLTSIMEFFNHRHG